MTRRPFDSIKREATADMLWRLGEAHDEIGDNPSQEIELIDEWISRLQVVRANKEATPARSQSAA